MQGCDQNIRLHGIQQRRSSESFGNCEVSCGNGRACHLVVPFESSENARGCTTNWSRAPGRRSDRLVVRTQSGQILRVECPQRCCDSRPDSDDAFFHAWPKQRDPKIATKKQLGAAHRGWATGMSRAIMLHLLDRSGCIIDDAALRPRVTVLLHPDSTTHACGNLDVIFFVLMQGRDRIFTYRTIHRVPDCGHR